MRHAVSEPVGVRVGDLALHEVDDQVVAELRQLLAHHGVVIMPGQRVDDAAFVTFLRRFGELAFTAGETSAPGFPDLNVVSNVGRAAPPRSTFHVDTSYVRSPPAYTALRAVTIPDRGGETLFTNQYRAFETLPPDIRETLRGRTITHVVTGVEAERRPGALRRAPGVSPPPDLRSHDAVHLDAQAVCRGQRDVTGDKGPRWSISCTATRPRSTTSTATPGRAATS